MSLVSWTPEMEVNLFYAMIDHKPVGENRHFHMIFIYERFNDLNDKKLSVEQLWQHLNTLYDINGLDENEIVSFPSEDVEFTLPQYDCATSAHNLSDDSESSLKVLNTSAKSDSSTGQTKAATTTSTQSAGAAVAAASSSSSSSSSSALSSSSAPSGAAPAAAVVTAPATKTNSSSGAGLKGNQSKKKQ